MDTAEGQNTERERGREADAPTEIPPRGWRDVAWRVKDEVNDDHVATFAAGVAFFGLLALFPALGAILAVAALAVDPQTIASELEQVLSALPPAAAEILQGQAREVAASAGGGASLAAAAALLFSLYSASKGMKVLIEGINIAYDEKEERGFLKLNLLAFGLTLAGIVVLVAALIAMIGVPVMLGRFGLPPAVEGCSSMGAGRFLPGRQC